MARKTRRSSQATSRESTKSASPTRKSKSSATKSPSPLQQTFLPSPTPSTDHHKSLPQVNLIPHPRLYHAMVDVELTAQPILQIVSKMAANATADLESKAVASGTTNIRGLDWTDLAKQSITKAEADARETVMNLIGPIAKDAFAKVKGADEGEVGTEVMIPEEDRGLVRAGSTVSSGEAGESVLETIPEEVDGAEDDAEMIDADVAANPEDIHPGQPSTDQVSNAPGPSASAVPTDNDDEWTGTCYCGYGDVFGDKMIACEGRPGQACRHGWYHFDCLKVALYKGHLPGDDLWTCPYCGDYSVKAAMVPATMMKKEEHRRKIKQSGQPMLLGF